MDGVGGITNQNHYDDSDIERMKGLETVSTQSAINRIGNHAGLDENHTVHGSDKTSKEVVAEHREAVRQQWSPKEVVHEELGHAAGHGLEHLAEHGAARFAFRALGGVALPIHLVLFAKEMVESVADDAAVGHERAEAVVKSAMHTVILGSLNGLPQDFVNQQRARYAEDAPDGLVRRMSGALGRDNNLMGVIQLHCDQGITAARAMYATGQTPAAYSSAHPDVAKRIAEDPSFKAGFEGAVWAHEHGQYDDVMKALDARDARYAQHQIAFRG